MDTMKCENEKKHCCAKMCIKVAKLVMGLATVAATICVAKELHRVHRAIENHHHHK